MTLFDTLGLYDLLLFRSNIPYLFINTPLRVTPAKFGDNTWCELTRTMGLLFGENILTVDLVILTVHKYTSDKLMDQMKERLAELPWHIVPALCGKNQTVHRKDRTGSQ